MKIRIRIEIDIEGLDPRSDVPESMAWEHDQHALDNPSFYSAELQRALGSASEKAARGLGAFDGRP